MFNFLKIEYRKILIKSLELLKEPCYPARATINSYSFMTLQTMTLPFKVILQALNKLTQKKVGKQSILMISACTIDDDRLDLLLLALSKLKLKKIKSIDLSENELTWKGVKALSDFIKKKHISLTKLRLNDNKLDDSGANIITELLKNQPSLKELYLGWNNEIGPLVLKSLVKGLIKNNSITILELHGNVLDDECLNHLLQFITKENSSLRTLDIGYNDPIASGALQSFLEAIGIKSRLTDLSIEKLGFNFEIHDTINFLKDKKNINVIYDDNVSIREESLIEDGGTEMSGNYVESVGENSLSEGGGLMYY